jgi:hypothetical protein
MESIERMKRLRTSDAARMLAILHGFDQYHGRSGVGNVLLGHIPAQLLVLTICHAHRYHNLRGASIGGLLCMSDTARIKQSAKMMTVTFLSGPNTMSGSTMLSQDQCLAETILDKHAQKGSEQVLLCIILPIAIPVFGCLTQLLLLVYRHII